MDDEKLRMLKMKELKNVEKVQDVKDINEVPRLQLDELPTIGKGTREIFKRYG